MNKISPVLLLILGLLVGFPAARLVTAPAEKPEPATKTESAKAGESNAGTAAPRDRTALAQESCKPEEPKAALYPWCMPVSLLRQFFSLPAAVEKTRGESLRDILDRARDTQYDLRFMVALVPAVPDPRMDQALDAIQRGFANSKNRRPGGFPPAPDSFLLDRVWLPWVSGEAGPEKPYQAAPGVLLFRGTGPRALEVVFLVPETSKMGIQKDTFREALDLIADLQEASIEPRVSILGPSFSGSAESLRLALLSWRQERGGLLAFRAASGSATADHLEALFDEVGVSFCRAALPDSVLQVQALRFLNRKMGWKLRKVGLLVEDDTQYGQSFVGGTVSQRLVLFTFPSHLADLRNAWEDQQKAEKAKEGNPLQPNRRALDLDLSGQEREADLVPTFSSTTTSSNDLLFSNLLQTIAREGIRYVGIVATDPKDKLFLAEKLRQLAPDVVLFTFDNNLLYAHPDHTQEMNGMLVLSSYPLFTEGAPGFPSPKEFKGLRRQFGSEYQQGVFEAVRYLLGASLSPKPQAWIAATGNGSLWPVAQLPVDPESLGGARFCGWEQQKEEQEKLAKSHKPAEAGMPPTGFDGKDDLQILLVVALFCLLAVRLNRAALLEEAPGAPVDPGDGRPIHDVRGNRGLLVLGAGLLAAATGVLLAVTTLPLWADGWDAVKVSALRPSQWTYLLILTAAYGWLVWNLARAAHGERLGLKAGAFWTIGGLAAFALLVLGVLRLCVPGGQAQLFYLRARAFSSGLSPLVPLAAMAGALYLWLWSELKRRRLLVRLASDCPLESLCDPAVTGSATILRSLYSLLTRTWPRRLTPRETPPWILPVIVFVPAVFLLWGTVQPIGEARPFGRLFILLVLMAYSLSALSFYRFVRLWRETLRVLHRLDNSSPAVAQAFEAISKELDWRPIQSFGWRIPPFRSLLLSVQKLRELAAAGKVTIAGPPGALDDALKGMFENEREEGSVREIEHRNVLERIFSRACVDLRDDVEDPAVRQFLALRVAAYLRFVFAHLRSCLIGALASGLLTLLAVATYAFEPKHLVSLGGWLGLAVAVGIALWIFVQMDRDPTLSRIGGTTPGQVTLDRAFLTKLVTYAGVPVLGLVATQIPGVGQTLGRAVGQLLRIVGGG
ncbi:MAG TPA: hypothetical protein VLB76_19590 [Thermoanaerobaculia bacterium]|jgi:hypothetical protein|nr:hypothetical protein [Thermoanaerobaculia bacterium]